MPSKKTMPRLVIPLSKSQKEFLYNNPISASQIRILIRDFFLRKGLVFPSDQLLGVRYDFTPRQIEHWKQILLEIVLEKVLSLLPTTPDYLGNIITLTLHELIQDLEQRQNFEVYYQLLTQGNQILKEQGFCKFMNWFGLKPIWKDNTYQVIEAFRIVSADED